MSADVRSLSNSIGRRSSRCRRRATSWRNGSRVASTSIITSRLTTISTACRISSCTSGSRRASRRAPSNSSSTGGAAPRMPATPAAAGLRRNSRTCRGRIGLTPNGRRRASSRGPNRPAPPPGVSSRASSSIARIPNRVTARASG